MPDFSGDGEALQRVRHGKRLPELRPSDRFLALLRGDPIRIEMESVHVATDEDKNRLPKCPNIYLRRHACVEPAEVTDGDRRPGFMASDQNSLCARKNLAFMKLVLGGEVAMYKWLGLQDQLDSRVHGQFRDLVQPKSVRKLQRVFGEHETILKLKIAYGSQRGRSRNRGTARIRFWRPHRGGLREAAGKQGSED